MDSDELDTFGGLLHLFRKRRQLTQQQLADAIGMHRHAISRWEQGQVLPKSKAIVLELVQLLRLNEQEARVLLEASLTAPLPLWGVPLPRNPLFTGREEVLKSLHHALCDERRVKLVPSYALQGLGGVGKTQVALEYVYRYALEYRALFWIEAQTLEQVHGSLQHIAALLGLPEHAASDPQRVVAAVGHWLATHEQWLLVWDHLQDLHLPHRLLPPPQRGTFLVTTRCQVLGPLLHGIEIEPMPEQEGLLFLLRRAKILEPAAESTQVQQLAERLPGEYAAAGSLVTILGGLPLALDQAGAYLEETGCSLHDYLHHYEVHPAWLLARRGSASSDHPHSVVTTFLLAAERVQQEEPATSDLLKACTVLHAHAIPLEVFVQGAAHLGPALEALASDALHFDRVMAVLRHHSLITRHPQAQTLCLHRLVQAVLREQMGKQEQTLWLYRLVAALDVVFPEVLSDTRQQCERLLPHVLTVAAALSDASASQAFVRLLRKAADALRERTQYEQARLLYARVLRICAPSQLYARELAQALTGLGRLSYEQGCYEQAETWYQQALQGLEQIVGVQGPELARPLNDLGLLYQTQGKQAEAQALYQRAWRLLQQTMGPEPPNAT